MRIRSALLALSALTLGGCTSLLGDFTYDPNGNANGGNGNMVQGDIVVMPTMLTTSEQGAKANFTVVLKRPPTADVTVALASSNDGEGKVTPKLLTFSKDNFGAPQMAQVTGVDDTKEDGPQTYFIITSPATSEDKTYHGIDPIDPQVTNVDDDTAGFMLVPTAGLTTTESGGQAMFTIALNHAPTADVQISLTTDNMLEGTVSPASLMFTAANWMAPQVVTVTGVDDAVRDGPQKYHVVTGAATSTDPKYNGLNPPDAEVTNNDNDTANVVLMPSTGLLTSEKGDMTSLTIALGSPPTGDVVIGLTSSDVTEGTVMPESVTFTSENWMAPQVISVTGVDDDRIDGNQPYQVVTTIVSSGDPGYATLEPPNADVTNIDDDTPGLRLTPTEGLVTSEDLESATFTVVLNSKPSGDVLLDVTSSRPTEGVATPASLHFTDMNWDAPQTVSVMGVDDDVQDKDQPYLVQVTMNAATMDGDYATLLEQDVSVINRDNDSAGVIVTPTKGLTTTEAGGTATFTVKLTSQPTADVKIALSSSNTAEGTVSPASLTFTADNFRAEQLVTVRGVDDRMQDGGQPYHINTDNAVSTDPNYQGIEVANVDVTNTDNDTAGITVKPNNNVTLTTTERGDTATFTVELNSQPSADVSFSVSSTDTTEGTLSPGNLTFTSTNWNGPQTVTLKGVDDPMHDGPQLYRATFGMINSKDPLYAKLARPLDVKASNTDNDSPGITLKNIANLATTEKGAGTATFQVVLDSEPSANVDIGLSSSRTTEGTVSPAKLTFTNLNWASPQNVTITGVDEKVQDGNQSYFIIFAAATSADKDYQGLVPRTASVPVTNIDDDSAGIVVEPKTGLATSEPNGTTMFTVRLQSQPTADVTIPLKSSKTTEGTVSPASLTFTAANWSAPRTVTLTGVDDSIKDGNQQYAVSVGPATSTDAKYAGMSLPDLVVFNNDDDVAKILVDAKDAVETTEKLTSVKFTIRLQTQPTADVTVPVISKDLTEGTAAPASVTFTSVNWASPQEITVTGVDDKMQDGNQPYLIDVGAATSKDANYQGMDPDDVSLTNVDDDTAHITVSQISAITYEKPGADTATFTIVLDTQPTAAVTLTFKSSDTSEGTLSDSSVVFSTTDWSSPRTITVTGVQDDGTADGDQEYSVTFSPSTSTDKNYSGKTPASLVFKNRDDDSPDILVSATKGTTSEDPKVAPFTFTIVLKSKPKADVTVPITSSNTDEGTVSPSSLTFTPANWQSKQTVTVTGVQDQGQADGSPVYTISIGAPTTTDATYADIDPPDVSMTNIDDDSAGFNVSPPSPSNLTYEVGGAQVTFTITLKSKPAANVTIPVMSSDNTEGSIKETEIVLTPTDWNNAAAHTIKVFGEDDDIQDDDQPYTIVTGLSSSTDPNYDKKPVDDVSFKNIDNDTADYTVTPLAGHTTEAGGTFKFSVSLNSQPTGPVSIPIASNNTAEGVLDKGITSIDFTTTNWNTPQTVQVDGVNDPDPVADGNVDYKIILGKPTTTDANYAKLKPPDISLTNDDDDTAALDVNALSLKTSETGMPTVTIKVALTTKPKSTVTIPLKSSNEAEGVITLPDPNTLTFDATNWDVAQSITVTGVDDDVLDPDTKYTIQIGPPQSTDAKYSKLPASSVMLTNVDDEMPP